MWRSRELKVLANKANSAAKYFQRENAASSDTCSDTLAEGEVRSFRNNRQETDLVHLKKTRIDFFPALYLTYAV